MLSPVSRASSRANRWVSSLLIFRLIGRTLSTLSGNCSTIISARYQRACPPGHSRHRMVKIEGYDTRQDRDRPSAAGFGPRSDPGDLGGAGGSGDWLADNARLLHPVRPLLARFSTLQARKNAPAGRSLRR